MGFPTAYAGPPLTGSGGLVLLVGFRGEKRLANGSLGRRKIPAFPGGRRARTARTKHGRGPWPRPCFGRLSKKWLAPLFRGFHSSLAPTARPGSYAEKPLLRKAFCGFAVHAAKSDYSLRGLRPPNPQGFFDRLTKHGRGPWPRPCFGFAGLGGPRAPQTRKTPPPPGAPQRRPATPTPARFRRPYSGGSVAPRKAPAFQRGAAAFGGSGAARRAAPLPQTKERARGQRPRAPLFQGASRPAAAVRKGRWAWPPRRLPSTSLLTGLPPRFFRHWRRSAPPPSAGFSTNAKKTQRNVSHKPSAPLPMSGAPA